MYNSFLVYVLVLGYSVNTEGAEASFNLGCKTRGSKVGYNHKLLG